MIIHSINMELDYLRVWMLIVPQTLLPIWKTKETAHEANSDWKTKDDLYLLHRYNACALPQQKHDAAYDNNRNDPCSDRNVNTPFLQMRGEPCVGICSVLSPSVACETFAMIFAHGLIVAGIQRASIASAVLGRWCQQQDLQATSSTYVT